MRTEQTLERLEAELQQNCGDMLAACKAVGVSLIFVRTWLKDDAKVRDRLKEAEQVGTQGLVSAAIKRAVNGVEEDVYYQGDVVGTKTNYSDGLLQTLLKAKIDEFKPGAEAVGGGITVNIANVMPRASNYEEWMAMKERTLAPPPAQLPAPEEAEYVDVTPVHDFGGIAL